MQPFDATLLLARAHSLSTMHLEIRRGASDWHVRYQMRDAASAAGVQFYAG